MKTRKYLAAAAVIICAHPVTSWATRALGATITGEITASVSPTEIEVAHRRYHIEMNSPAMAAARSFFLGQVVDLVLDQPAAGKDPQVVAISAHVDR